MAASANREYLDRFVRGDNINSAEEGEDQKREDAVALRPRFCYPKL
jgi:hypothetical protein